MPNSPYDDLPERVQAAFLNRTMLSVGELAALLEMDKKTLSRHLENRTISGRIKGAGTTRRHWTFTIGDVARYLRSTHTVEKRRKELLYDLKDALARQPFRMGTMNVTLRRRRRKAKTALVLKPRDPETQET